MSMLPPPIRRLSLQSALPVGDFGMRNILRSENMEAWRTCPRKFPSLRAFFAVAQSGERPISVITAASTVSTRGGGFE